MCIYKWIYIYIDRDLGGVILPGLSGMIATHEADQKSASRMGLGY